MEQPDLETQVKEAKKLADKVREAVKKEWFTIYDIVNNSVISHDIAKNVLNNLATYGFLKTVSSNGKFTHKLLFSKKEREEGLEEQILRAGQEIKVFKSEIQRLKELKKIKTSPLISV